MEQKEPTAGILNLMVQPTFTVQNGVISLVNTAAEGYMLTPGMRIEELLYTGAEEYAAFSQGCLYLSLSIAGTPCGASVRRMGNFDIFTLEQESEQAELQAMALAAQELRGPLSSVMSVADRLFPLTDEEDHPETKDQVSRINRGLFQMLRIVSNMSDAYRYCQQSEPRLSVQNVTEVMGEIFEKTIPMLAHAGVSLTFTNLPRAVFSLVDMEKLERGIHNILSNAVKFSPKGSPIEAKLSQKGNRLYLTVQDRGTGIHNESRGNVHTRFQRQPGLEDSRFGIGLGMVLIRSAATAHGGTVLIDQPQGCGTRITMTMVIRQDTDNLLRSSTLNIDYAGERDHLLIELSDVLPQTLYGSEYIN